jgi:hypothetical protein
VASATSMPISLTPATSASMPLPSTGANDSAPSTTLEPATEVA